jgi:hypothetical protein
MQFLLFGLIGKGTDCFYIKPRPLSTQPKRHINRHLSGRCIDPDAGTALPKNKKAARAVKNRSNGSI